MPADGFVVLAPETPPDASKPLALFIVGPLQGSATCEANAIEWKILKFPTGTVQACTVEKYNTSVNITP